MAALELNTEAFLRICTPDPVKMMGMVRAGDLSDVWLGLEIPTIATLDIEALRWW